jgi:hypothetical protein
MWQAFSALFSPSRRTLDPAGSVPPEKHLLHCFHCQETMRANQIVRVPFAGSEREVCCHGCAAVLRTLEHNGLGAQYLARRA